MLLPVDIAPELYGPATALSFCGTRVALVQPLQRPPGQWQSLEIDGAPVWWRNRAGAVMPAWNFYGVCTALLLALKERNARDLNTPFSPERSVRVNGLLGRPTVNEAFALLAAVLCGLADGTEVWLDLGSEVLPPLLFLSHDCDNLLGNALWLQISRAARFLLPARAGAPDWRQIRWMLKGILRPRQGFADEIRGFMDLEEANGFFSRFYFLSGPSGRLGARASLAATLAVAREVRPPHEVGLHYNYDAWRDDAAMMRQARALREPLSVPVKAGRAHYWRLDPDVSPPLWEAAGIRLDESFGSDEVPLYRLGLAGVFPWFDLRADRECDLAECPLLFEDMALLEYWRQDALSSLLSEARHIAAVGGSLSLLFHPGYLANPEFQPDPSLYGRILSAMRSLGARQLTTEQILSTLGIGYEGRGEASADAAQ